MTTLVYNKKTNETKLIDDHRLSTIPAEDQLILASGATELEWIYGKNCYHLNIGDVKGALVLRLIFTRNNVDINIGSLVGLNMDPKVYTVAVARSIVNMGNRISLLRRILCPVGIGSDQSPSFSSITHIRRHTEINGCDKKEYMFCECRLSNGYVIRGMVPCEIPTKSLVDLHIVMHSNKVVLSSHVKG